MLRGLILAAARSAAVRRAVVSAPVSRGVVRRFVAGEGVDDALRVTGELQRVGLLVSLDHLGEDTTDADRAEAAVKAYLTLLDRLTGAGLAGGAEVSVKLTAVGQTIDSGLALQGAGAICAAARAAGTTVTVDMEDSSRTDATLRALHALRRDFPETGAVLQSQLRRTEDDCRALAYPGSRVRLCKGAYREDVSVAYQEPGQVSQSYRRCLDVLVAGGAYPMVATHDPALISYAAAHCGADAEFQLLYGVRPDEQRRLAAAGHRVRVYVPYGDEWYGYLMRRLAERPANLRFFLRALASRS